MQHQVSAFVDDKFTLKGHIAGVKGLFPAATFTYRPALPERRYEWISSIDRAAVGAKIIAEHVQSATFEGDPEPRKLVKETAKTLHGELFQGMIDYVLGFRGPVLEEEEGKS